MFVGGVSSPGDPQGRNSHSSINIRKHLNPKSDAKTAHLLHE